VRRSGAVWFVCVAGALIAAVVVLRSHGLSAWWFLDDLVQQSLISGNQWPRRAVWTLHSGALAGEAPGLTARGALPWWTDPEFGFAPLRPLTSGLIWWEYHTLWPRVPRFHVVSITLWVTFASLVALLYRRLLGGRTALLALAIFVCGRGHSEVTAWVGSQALLVAAVFSTGSLLAYLAYRETGRVWLLAAHALLFGLGLLGGEYAFSTAGYLLAHELLVERGPLARRARGLVPAGVLGAGYLVWYRLGGHGMRAVDSYVDVFSAPLQLVSNVLRSLPAHVVECLTAYPIEVGASGYSGWALATLLTLGWLLSLVPARDGEQRRRALVLLAGGLVALAPYGATFYSSRLGILGKVGIAPVLAVLLEDGVALALALGPRARRALGVAVALAVAGAHLAAAPWISHDRTRQIVVRNRAYARQAAETPIGPGSPEVVFALAAFNVPITQTLALSRVAQGKPLVPFRPLSAAFGPHFFERTGPASFVLETTANGLFSNPTAASYRRPGRGLGPGTEIRTDHLTVQVELAANGPVRMHFLFDEPLESPRYRFVSPLLDQFVAFEPPPIGTRLVIPAAFPPREVEGD